MYQRAPALPARRGSLLLVLLLSSLCGCGGESSTPAQPDAPRPPPAEPRTEAPAVEPPTEPAPDDPRPAGARTPDVAGTYLLDGAAVRVLLRLEEDGRFLMRSDSRSRTEMRVGKGRWHLKGTRLTLEYETVDGNPVEGGPSIEFNEYRGSSVLMRVPGVAAPFVLKKQQTLRVRPH